MIAKLKNLKVHNKQIDQPYPTPSPPHTHKTMEATINNDSTTTEQPLSMFIRSHWGLSLFYCQMFALDSAVVKLEKMLSSHGGFITYPMYHHGETIKYINILPGHKENGS